MRPNTLPEQPSEKPPFELACPSCGANDNTTSANAGLIVWNIFYRILRGFQLNSIN